MGYVYDSGTYLAPSLVGQSTEILHVLRKSLAVSPRYRTQSHRTTSEAKATSATASTI